MKLKGLVMKVVFLLFVISSIMLSSCSGMAGQAVMQVWMDQPLDGSGFQPGEVVLFQAHARDVNGAGITEINFYLNEAKVVSVSTDANAPLVNGSANWTAVEGEYSLYAVAVNGNGESVISPPVYFSVRGQRVNGADITDTPTPEITRTLTPTHGITPTITPTTPLPIVTFSADQTSLNAGECTTLRWTASFVNSLTLDGQQVNLNGSMEICPYMTTTYRLLAKTNFGDVARSVTVNVSIVCPPQRTSNIITMSISGGNCSIHRVGEVVDIYLTPLSTPYEFGWDYKLYDFTQAYIDSLGILQGNQSLFKQGSFSSGTPPIHYQGSISEPLGFEALELRLYAKVSGAEPDNWPLIWIYVVP